MSHGKNDIFRGSGRGKKTNQYGRENFELSGKRFGRRLTKVTKYFEEVRQFFIKKDDEEVK